MKDQEVMGSNQHRSVKGKSYSLVASYDEMNGLVDKGRAVDLVCLEFSKLFHIVSPKVFTYSLMRFGVDK